VSELWLKRCDREEHPVVISYNMSWWPFTKFFLNYYLHVWKYCHGRFDSKLILSVLLRECESRSFSGRNVVLTAREISRIYSARLEEFSGFNIRSRLEKIQLLILTMCLHEIFCYGEICVRRVPADSTDSISIFHM
jgi:hypothetical protein